MESISLKQFVEIIFEFLLRYYSNCLFIICYDVYQYLLNYWNEIMKDDVYFIIEDGWQVKVDCIIVKGKDKGWICEFILKELVIQCYFFEY